MKIKIKVAVAANVEGQWNAYGYHGDDDWDEIMNSFDALPGEQRFWVEAEVEVADQIATVQGVAAGAQ